MAENKTKPTTARLHIKRLSDVDQDVLRELIAASVKHIRGGGGGA